MMLKDKKGTLKLDIRVPKTGNKLKPPIYKVYLTKQQETMVVTRPYLALQYAHYIKERYKIMGYENVEVVEGNGYRGYEKGAPYDAIILSAAPKRIPEPLIEQLAPGGRIILPLGSYIQKLILLKKDYDGQLYISELLPVMFVPMVNS